MATKLEEFKWDRSYGSEPKYPWHEWLDGSIWELENGVDYEGVETKHFASSIYNAARTRGKKARIRVLEKGDKLVLQAYDPPRNEKSPPTPKS